jgi:hypothetical protein
MADTTPIWKQTVAGVASGLILLAVGWLFGVLPAVWNWMVKAASYAWSLVNYYVALPVWALIVAAALLFAVWRRVPRKTGSFSKAAVEPQSPPAPSEPTLTPLESQVVKALAQADGAWLSLDDLAAATRTSRLMIEQAVERLLVARLLLDRHNYIYGTSFRLSSTGRDLAIRQGHVAGALSAS